MIRGSALGELSRLRREFEACLTARADALCELAEAVLCADGPVTSLVELTLVAEHRRGHAAMYDALGQGRIEPLRQRRAQSSLPLPRAAVAPRCRCPARAMGRSCSRSM
jgi:hypothetical protein